MSNFQKAIFTFAAWMIVLTAVSQVKSIGTPFVRNYSRSTYHAGSQTWSIEEGNNGMMYFANNDGLLEFDGSKWKIYALPNNSILRSIKLGKDGILYAGGVNEIGYFKLGKNGGAVFHSLNDLLPADQRNFSEVWKIYIHMDGVIFQSFNQIMLYNNDSITIIKPDSSFHFSYMVNNSYYVNELKDGIMRYAMGNLYPLVGLEKIKGKEIWSMLPYGNKLLISTSSDGNFIYDGNTIKEWKNASNDFLKQNQVYCAYRLNNELLAFGTIQNGLLICTYEGKPVQFISMDDELQNNTILCIQQDNYGNLWLGTDHGIDYVEINSPLLQLSYNYGLSAGYTAIKYRDNLYLGTNQGLFVKHISELANENPGKKKFELVDKTRGQVWTLNEIDGTLFCGTHTGTYLIDGDHAKKISDIPGGWTFVKVPGKTEKIIGGTYTGLVLYQKVNGKWKFDKIIKGCSESARTLAFDNDSTLWMAHGYKGIFHFTLNSTFDSLTKIKQYNKNNSDLPTNDVSLSKVNGKIIFITTKNIYNFSKDKNTFLPDTYLNKILDGQSIKSLKKDNNDNYWYFTTEGTGVFRKREDGNYNNINIPFRQIEGKFVKGFEFVYPIDGQNVIFGAENGFIHYDPSFTKKYNYPFRTYIRYMQSMQGDSIRRFHKTDDGQPVVLAHKGNNEEFYYSASDFENAGKLYFSTFLEGYDNDWTPWQLRNDREFANLFEGDYVFRVKTKNNYDVVSQEASFQFKILPPFYRTVYAFIVYALMFLFILFLVAYLVRKRVTRSKLKSQREQEELFRKKEEQLQREALEAEKKVVQIRNEKLREEMKLKDKELANATMQMLHKNEMLITLRDEMKKLVADSKDEIHKHGVKYLARKINKEIDNEKQWEIFETQFENVHKEFLTRIKSAYPSLTRRELKLCAYLRMNVSSKEISVLMNISTRGVEISRYRLRKKLNLSRETNLTEFIVYF